MDNVNIRIETITPEMAERWLVANTHNRSPREAAVKYLVTEMQNGRWRVTGDTIKIGKSGRLLDGQHRLIAVVRSGVTIRSCVAYDTPDDCFSVIDRGVRRSQSDALKVAGYTNTIVLATVLAWIERYHLGKHMDSAYRNPSPERSLELALMYPDADDCIREYTSSKGNRWVGAQSAAAHYLFRKVDKAEADKFFRDFYTGENLSAGDPVLVARDTISRSTTSGAPNAMRTFAAIIQAWNRRRAGSVGMKGYGLRLTAGRGSKFKGAISGMPEMTIAAG